MMTKKKIRYQKETISCSSYIRIVVYQISLICFEKGNISLEIHFFTLWGKRALIVVLKDHSWHCLEILKWIWARGTCTQSIHFSLLNHSPKLLNNFCVMDFWCLVFATFNIFLRCSWLTYPLRVDNTWIARATLIERKMEASLSQL